MKNRINYLHYGNFFIQLIVISYLLATLSIVAGWRITPVVFPLALVLAVFLSLRKEGCKRILAMLGLVALCLLWAVFFYDYSFDGQWYHTGTITQLVNGWNPIYDAPIDIYTVETANLWINHYARGMETVAACIASAVFDIEAGKALNLFFLFGTFFYSLYFLHTFLQQTKTWMIVWISLLIVFNPVVVNQLFTYYIDYSLYSILVSLLFSLYALERNEERKLSVLTVYLLLFFAVGIKFNILFWTFMFMLCYVVWHYIKKKRIPRYVYAFLLSGILGVVIGAYNPYVTNTLTHGNPFYPLVGEGKVDIMTPQVSEAFNARSEFVNVCQSLISNPLNGKDVTPADLSIFSLSKANILASGATDTRMGGFGIFFFEASVILLLLLCFARLSRSHLKSVLLVLALLLLSLFILPSGWWARYVAYFYAFPLVLIIALMKWSENRSRYIKWVQYCCMLMLSVDICCSGGLALLFAITHRIQTENVLQTLSEQDEEYRLRTVNISLCNKLKENNIRYENVSGAIYPDTLRSYGPTTLFSLQDNHLHYDKILWVSFLKRDAK